MKNKYFFITWIIVLLISCSGSKESKDNPNEEPDKELKFTEMKRSKLSKSLVAGRIYHEIVENPKIIDDFRDLGIQWMRIEFEEFIDLPAGESLTSVKVQANVDKFKEVIKQAHNNNIKVLGVIGYNSFQNKEVPLNESLVKKFTECVKWHLDTYGIDAVEIWNEPGGFGFSPKENLKWYGSILIDIYDNLKSKYPNVLFIGPVTANAEAGEWLGRHDWQKPEQIEGENSIFNTQEMRDWRTKNKNKLPLDIVSWHVYGSGQASPLGDFYFGRSFRTYFNEIVAYKDLDGRSIVGNYPIWVTEYGWTSNNKPGNGVDEVTQQKNFNNILTEFENTSSIENVFWYNYKDDENLPGSEGNANGLIKSSLNDFKRKPIYYSFMSRNIGVGFTKNNETLTTIVEKYISLGGIVKLAYPVYSGVNSESENSEGYAHKLSSELYVQHFLDNKEPIAIIYYKNIDKAYFVPTEFYRYYFKNNATLGKPMSDPKSENGILSQEFENACLKYIDKKVVLVQK